MIWKCLKNLVGAGRFERPTPCAQGRCATRLRYAPTFYFSDFKLLPDLLQEPVSSTVTKPQTHVFKRLDDMKSGPFAQIE